MCSRMHQLVAQRARSLREGVATRASDRVRATSDNNIAHVQHKTTPMDASKTCTDFVPHFCVRTETTATATTTSGITRIIGKAATQR